MVADVKIAVADAHATRANSAADVDRRHPQRPLRPRLLHPRDVVVARVDHGLHVRGQRVEGLGGPVPAGLEGGIGGQAPQRGPFRPQRLGQVGEGLSHLGVSRRARRQPGADERLEDPIEAVPVAPQPGRRRQPGHRRHPSRGEGDPQGAGHHVGRLVGLVEDHHVVVGQDVTAGGDVGAEQVEVDDDHIRLPGPFVGGLGEAALPARALLGPRALVRPDAHRRPRRRAGLEVQLGPVAGEADLPPRQEPGHLPPDGPPRLAADAGPPLPGPGPRAGASASRSASAAACRQR